MATLTKEQIEQKLQQLVQLTEEANALVKELAEAGAIEIPEDDLDKVSGGRLIIPPVYRRPRQADLPEPQPIPCPD